MITTENYSKY